MRYTPAGTPVVDFRLSHRSEQIEAGATRKVECEVTAQALGEIALALAQVLPGAAIRVQGFLVKRSRASDFLVLHVNRFKLIDEDTNGIQAQE